MRYAVVAPPGAEPVVSDESHDVAWFPADALPPEAVDDLSRLVDRARAALLAGSELSSKVSRRSRRPASSCRRVVVGEPEPGGRRHALEVAAGPLGAREPLDLGPEVRPVAGDQQVRQLVHQDVVDDPGGIPCSRVESRMVRSTGVQEPHRLPWLVTQRTLTRLGPAAQPALGQRPARGPAGRCRWAAAWRPGGPAARA